MDKFLSKRKQENRKSLLIDNINLTDIKERIEEYNDYSPPTTFSINTETESIFTEHSKTSQETTQEISHKCKLCKNNKDDKFIILNCGHIFHITCLVETQFDQYTLSNGIINNTFFNNCTCSICNSHIDIEDILHIHNKYHKTTKDLLNKTNHDIEYLDKQLAKIREETLHLIEYKQKIESKREKSKQITITINNLI